jgi:UDP-GlcNAc:undecaprenyl-phosphate/decaprenyl-phosphate GlcNAc-1-phosphate transferase
VTFVIGAAALVPLLIGAFAAAALISVALTPLIRAVVRRRGIVDAPNHRRVNTLPVPRGGGLAVVVAFVVVGGGLALLHEQIGPMPSPRPITDGQLAALFLGGVVAALIGAADDLFDLRARWQLLGQVGLAALAVVLGVRVGLIGNPFGPGTIEFAAPFGVAFTVVWVVGMINSINFIDGLDGLSTGIALIAALTLGILSLTTQVGQVGQPFVTVLCVVLAGGLLGFLRFNFQPASIFQGTAGVMFMGYTLAVLSILGAAKVVVALLVLGVPIVDTFWVIVRRLIAGKSPFTPDRGHIHHRLLDLGLGHRATVLLIYAICASLGLVSLLVSTATQVYAFLGALVGFGIALFLLTRGPREALEPDTYETEAVEPGAGSEP